jgi:hypothetical protein
MTHSTSDASARATSHAAVYASTHSPLRESIDMLLQEAYDGPPDPKSTWFVNNHSDGGVLGTVRHLTTAQAWHRPDGLAHSVAEHVAHILFSLNHVSRCASSHARPDADWDKSWDVGEPDDAHWLSLQRQLRESHLRLRMWVHADETFETKESIALLVGAIAHTAYHLGAIRQVATLAIQQAPNGDPAADQARPL